jgi:hypothetical protein
LTTNYIPKWGGSIFNNSLIYDTGTNVGIGTTSPAWNLEVAGTRPSFDISDFSAGTNLKHWLLSSEGGNFYLGTSSDSYATTSLPSLSILGTTNSVGIASTSPYLTLGVGGAVAATYYNADATTSTSTFAGGVNIGNGSISYDWNSGTTTIGYLEAGNMNFAADSGNISWIDLPVTAASASGVQNSYSASINGYPLLTLSALADGNGDIIATSTAIGIGTTTPAAMLDIYAGSFTTTSSGYAKSYNAVNISNIATSSTASVTKAGLNIQSTGSWSGTSASNIGLYVSSVSGGTNNYDAIFNGGGNVGVATTSPWGILSVTGTSTTDTRPLFVLATTTSAGTATVFQIDSNGLLTINTPSATSTINGNLYVNGTLRGSNVYTGDLFFGNGFSMTEATNTPAGLYLKNQNNVQIANVDENGNLALAGDICTSNVNCFSSAMNTVRDMAAQVSSLASSSQQFQVQNIAAGTSLNSAIQTLNSNFRGLSTNYQQLTTNISDLSSTTADVSSRLATLESAFASSTDASRLQTIASTLQASTTFMDDLASSTANILLAGAINPTSSSSGFAGQDNNQATSTSFIGKIASAVQGLIQSTGNWIMDKFTARIAYIDRVEAKVAAVSQGLEMTDQATGALYCVVIRNGNWDKQPGACASVAADQTSTSTSVTSTTTTDAATQAAVINNAITNNQTPITNQNSNSNNPSSADAAAGKQISSTPVNTTNTTAATTTTSSSNASPVVTTSTASSSNATLPSITSTVPTSETTNASPVTPATTDSGANSAGAINSANTTTTSNTSTVTNTTTTAPANTTSTSNSTAPTTNNQQPAAPITSAASSDVTASSPSSPSTPSTPTNPTSPSTPSVPSTPTAPTTPVAPADAGSGASNGGGN